MHIHNLFKNIVYGDGSGLLYCPAEKSHFFAIYDRCVTLADGLSLPLEGKGDRVSGG